jgi:hypothetical protein
LFPPIVSSASTVNHRCFVILQLIGVENAEKDAPVNLRAPADTMRRARTLPMNANGDGATAMPQQVQAQEEGNGQAQPNGNSNAKPNQSPRPVVSPHPQFHTFRTQLLHREADVWVA